MSKPNNETVIDMQLDCSSGEIIGHDEDVMSEILVNLPKKSLIRFKLVSKQWLSWISETQFLSRYSRLHPHSLSGFFLVPQQLYERDDEDQIEYVSLNKTHSKPPVLTFFNYRNIKILQSCNGLLLSCHGKKHYVFNPTTEKSQLIPTCPNQIVNKHGLKIDFSPTVSTYYSLAFDPKNSLHYKIICLRKSVSNMCNIDIYSSKFKLWRLSNNAAEFPAPRDIDFTKPVYCNGALHWTKRTPRGLYFNIDTEMINHMPELPRIEQYICEYFGHSRGHLHCVLTMEGLNYYEVFELESDYSAWVLKSRIELDALARKFPDMVKEINYQNNHFNYQYQVLSVVCSNNNGRVLKIIMSIPAKIIAYNCKKKTTWKIYDTRLSVKDRKLWYNVYGVYDYFESLIPL